jgi:hypothetical protein
MDLARLHSTLAIARSRRAHALVVHLHAQRGLSFVHQAPPHVLKQPQRLRDGPVAPRAGLARLAAGLDLILGLWGRQDESRPKDAAQKRKGGKGGVMRGAVGTESISSLACEWNGHEVSISPGAAGVKEWSKGTARCGSCAAVACTDVRSKTLRQHTERRRSRAAAAPPGGTRTRGRT